MGAALLPLCLLLTCAASARAAEHADAVESGGETKSPNHAAPNLTTTLATLEALQTEVKALQAIPADVKTNADDLASFKSDADTFFLVLGACLIFFMQPGFALLEAGCVRSKNTKAIMLKNIIDGSISIICFFTVGYQFAMGNGNGFIGYKNFWGLADDINVASEAVPHIPFDGAQYATWWFQVAFAATASTILSGAVAERMAFPAFICCAVFLSSFVYPVVVHWAWSSTGWASAFRDVDGGFPLFLDVGLLDFAGCSVIHMVGGIAAFVGCWTVGPREGRFVDGKPVDIAGQSAVMQTIGVFFLWFGWYGFNCFSMLMISGGAASTIARIAVNTTLAAAIGALTCLIITYVKDKYLSLEMTLNGVLAGLVSITAACSTVEPWACFPIAIIGSLVYLGVSSMMTNVLKLDDVVDAVAVHFACGIWGVISGALFTSQRLYSVSYGVAADTPHYGLLYGGGWNLLGVAVLFVITVTAWTTVLMFALLKGYEKTVGSLRVTPEAERAGADRVKHGGAADPEMAALAEDVSRLLDQARLEPTKVGSLPAVPVALEADKLSELQMAVAMLQLESSQRRVAELGGKALGRSALEGLSGRVMDNSAGPAYQNGSSTETGHLSSTIMT